jgi:hypothetical protein
VVFLVDKNGQLIAATPGDVDQHRHDLARVAHRRQRRRDRWHASLIGENEFAGQFHRGREDQLLHRPSLVQRLILVVHLRRPLVARPRAPARAQGLGRAQQRSSTALVKQERGREPTVAGSPFAEISDEDIDNLFSE